jgi:hypothetical protein
LIRVTGTADWAGVCTAETAATSPKTSEIPKFRIANAPERNSNGRAVKIGSPSIYYMIQQYYYIHRIRQLDALSGRK